MLQYPPPPKPPVAHVTIWIHGTHPHAFLPTGLADLTQKAEQLLLDCEKGLHKAQDLDLQYYQYTLTKELSAADPDQFPWDDFYIFGWSGELDHNERVNAAYELYCSLKSLAQEYERQNISPKFTIITHSHGGNLALNMAALPENDGTIIINRLIVLACPVQHYTTALVSNPMFERIYSIHSHTDMVQVLDPQGLHQFMNVKKGDSFLDIWKNRKKIPLFSKRHFPVQPKIIQACIKWKNGVLWLDKNDPLDTGYLKPIKATFQKIDKIKKNRGLMHLEFKLTPFVTQLPKIIVELDTHFLAYSHCITNADPDVLIQL